MDDCMCQDERWLRYFCCRLFLSADLSARERYFCNSNENDNVGNIQTSATMLHSHSRFSFQTLPNLEFICLNNASLPNSQVVQQHQ
jgi:hypothetical protein